MGTLAADVNKQNMSELVSRNSSLPLCTSTVNHLSKLKMAQAMLKHVFKDLYHIYVLEFYTSDKLPRLVMKNSD